MSKKRLVAAMLGVLAVAVPAMAQDPRVEVSGTVGWTFSDGVEGDPRIAGNGQVYDRLNPEDSVSWGLGLGVLAGPNGEVGFLWGQQMSKLLAGGTTETEIGDMSVSTYHGYFGWNFFTPDAPYRPYLYLASVRQALAASLLRGSEVPPARCDGLTKFSTTWGAGVKGFASRNVGFRGGLQWTPTYIKSDAEGWWCDPYWGGCYVVGDAQYSNQWSFNGGVLFRF